MALRRWGSTQTLRISKTLAGVISSGSSFYRALHQNKSQRVLPEYIVSPAPMSSFKYKTAAILPVKGTSLRAPSKNFRPFGDSNLTHRKIKLLQSVAEIDAIYVSSDFDYVLEMAESLGCETVRRDPDGPYSGACNASMLFYHLAYECDAENVMICNITSPLVTAETVRTCVNKFDEALALGYDSVNSVQNNKEFFWRDGIPLNYDPKQQVRSQDLPDIFNITYGVNIAKRETILSTQNIVGHNPMWYEIPALEAVDVDHPLDMCIAELLWVNGIRCQQDVDKYYAFHSTRYPLPAPAILDCSLSELSPEGKCAYDPNIEARRAYLQALDQGGVQYAEVGARLHDSTNIDTSAELWQLCSDETISSLLEGMTITVKIGLLVQPGISRLEDFKPKSESPFGYVRIFLPQQKQGLTNNPVVEEWMAFAQGLVDLGYEVIVSIDCAAVYSDDDLAYFCETTRSMPFSVMVVEDTYGTLNEDRTNKLIQKCRHQLSFFNAKCQSVGFLPRTTVENGLAQCHGAVAAGSQLILTTASTCDSSLLSMDTELALASFWSASASLCNFNPAPILNLTVPTRDETCKHNVRRWLLTLTGMLQVHPQEAVKLATEQKLTWEECCDHLVVLSKE